MAGSRSTCLSKTPNVGVNTHQIHMGATDAPVDTLPHILLGPLAIDMTRLWTQTKNADTARALPALINGIFDSYILEKIPLPPEPGVFY